MTIEELGTPCLVVDQDRLLSNVQEMQQRADSESVPLRPHIKTHKSTFIARLQQAHGAKGITVAKVGEAAVFARAGFDNIRIAYPVVGRDKLERIAALAQDVHISFCVESDVGAQAASAFFRDRDADADVLLEIDTGHGRTGVPWDQAETVAFARHVAGLPGLNLTGILTHGGHAYHVGRLPTTERAPALADVARQERDRMLAVGRRLRDAGLAIGEVSIGSTPTMRFFRNEEREGLRITEIRPGNYVFRDRQQLHLGCATLESCALTVLATVVGKRRNSDGSERIFVDAGKKILSSDTGAGVAGFGLPLYNPARMIPLPHATIVALSEEHGWLNVPGGSTLSIGDRLHIVPNHACMSMNTQDVAFLVDRSEVIEQIQIDARGQVV